MRSMFLALALTACAQAGGSNGGGGSDVDAAVQQQRDAAVTTHDSSVTPDGSTACTTVTQNILLNSSFDGAPTGTNWNATPIDSTLPIITSDAGGVAAQSGTFRAWMAGLERTASTNKDVMYQDVMIPASTTKLEFKGFYEVRTGEIGTNIYDRATIELTSTTNTQLELIKALDDNGATTAWTAFGKVFTSAHAGTTVRVRFSTASDSLDATSFFFDTLELDATYCQ